MKTVASGNGGRFPLVSLVAILSLSLTVNLPGLGISPIQGRLDTVFPGVSDLEIQLLTVLPNFVIIPFILFAGSISNRRNQSAVLFAGLLIYTLCGVAYLLASTMAQLIVISCVLGVGCGLVIPLAAGMVAQNFSGTERTRWLGIKSGIANFSIIFATLFVGWIAAKGWHWSFAIYLLPALPLALLPWMTRRYIENHTSMPSTVSTVQQLASGGTAECAGGHVMTTLLGLIALYVAFTYAVEAITYNLPFAMAAEHLSTASVGVATALFFLGITLGGFALPAIIKMCRRLTPYWAILLCIIGLALLSITRIEVADMVASLLIGLGYGIMQPLIYDKATALAPSKECATRYLAYVLAGNYVGIAVAPFIVDGVERLVGDTGGGFSFGFNAVFMVVVLIIGVIKRKSFVFNISDAAKL